MLFSERVLGYDWTEAKRARVEKEVEIQSAKDTVVA
jgi:hypothetical protein